MGSITRGPEQSRLAREEARLRRLEERVEALGRSLARHAPRGHGYDGMLGHGGLGGGDTTKRGNSVYFRVPAVRFGSQPGAATTVRSAVMPIQTGHSELLLFSSWVNLSHATLAVDSLSTRHSFTEFVAETNSFTRTATPTQTPGIALSKDVMGSTTGDFIINVYSTSAPTLIIEVLKLADFDAGTTTWTGVTVGGTNKPPALNGGLYWCGFNTACDKLVVLHGGSLYFGDITNSTTIDFNDTPITHGLTIPTTGVANSMLVGFGCDGDEYVIMKCTQDDNRVWDVERYQFQASGTTQTITDMLLSSGRPGANVGPWPLNLLVYEGQWCMHVDDNHANDGGQCFMSLERIGHGA